MGNGGEGQRLKKEPPCFFHTSPVSNPAPLPLAMVSLSAGAVSQTHPSEVRGTRQGREKENTSGRRYGSKDKGEAAAVGCCWEVCYVCRRAHLRLVSRSPGQQFHGLSSAL